ncbi:protein phosphatase 2C domain-containing protein [uncultured Xylophilus sp.]|uniref:PP2C family protein-serine/threonine phosphatase n=1 Tax=uncultured Xylophilus sp. TaxID=296832 RepID=UPI0025CF05D5|nr:protein phosphatase 2C domain-containing protein [uncultured Xylophilus sp.]
MTTSHRLIGATGTHKGDRPYQQDRVVLMSHPRVHGCVLGVVADGMGGRSGGRKAADQAVLTAQQLFDSYAPGRDDPAGFLRRIVEDAHLVIRLIAIAAEQEPHSTIAAFLVNPRGDCHWAHVGDSRIYHFRDGRLVQRTSDHSYVQTLVDRGELTPAEAHVHPQSNVLTCCLGTESDPPVALHGISRLRAGDCIVACSDGLWHYLRDGEFGAHLQDRPAGEAVRTLIDVARQRARGGGDNISLAVLQVETAAAANVAVPQPQRAPASAG